MNKISSFVGVFFFVSLYPFLLTGQLQAQMKDFFPLNAGMVMRYSLIGEVFNGQNLLAGDPFDKSEKDSGTVTYLVLGSSVVNDSLLYWSIVEKDSFFVKEKFSSRTSNYEKFYLYVSSETLVCEENIKGLHALSVSGTIWNVRDFQRYAIDTTSEKIITSFAPWHYGGSQPSLRLTPDSGIVSMKTNFSITGQTFYKGDRVIAKLLLSSRITINPKEFALYQNYPNPFNSTTSIEFGLPTAGYVSVKIYDILGRHIVTLFDGIKAEGNHKIVWSPQNLSGGVYFYRIESQASTTTKKMILLK
ncbi:MAG: T9SS type A sorting domain-containing protein [Ignavibacteriales bacterium]|nr:T9SS type A sorting domain-containing protein [Ignavibacteriales bacterium]